MTLPEWAVGEYVTAQKLNGPVDNLNVGPGWALQRRTTNLSIPTGSWRVCTFTDGDDDAGGETGNYTLGSNGYGINTTGLYLLDAGFVMGGSTSGRRLCGFSNATASDPANGYRTDIGSPGSTAFNLSFSKVMYLTNGDVASFKVFQDSGGSLNITAANFTIVRLGW